MKLNKGLLFAAAVAVTGLAASAAHASTVTAKLTETPTGTAGVFTVDVYAEVSGTTVTSGDGGLSGMQFDITAGGNASPPHGTGPNAGKATIAWDPSMTGNFTFIAPNYVADGSGHDSVGASFSDQSNFTDTTMGLGGFAHIASQTWTLTNNGTPAVLNLSVIGPTAYNFDATNSNFQENITSSSTTGVVLPAVPEPAALSLLGLGALCFVARRRHA